MDRQQNCFEALSRGERSFLKSYDVFLRANNVFRSGREQMFDKMFLLAYFRNAVAQNRVIADRSRLLHFTVAKNWEDFRNLQELALDFYEARELLQYPPLQLENKDIIAIKKAQLRRGALADVREEEYWIRKYAPGYSPGRDRKSRRYALNVNIHQDLFAELDAFALKYHCQYKFPKLEYWQQRIDPVLIYTADENYDAQAFDLKPVAARFLRADIAERTNSLSGERIADGLFAGFEKTVADIYRLGMRAKKDFPALAKALGMSARKNGGNLHPLSAGQFEVYEMMINTSLQVAAQDFSLEPQSRPLAKSRIIRGIRDTFAGLE